MSDDFEIASFAKKKSPEMETVTVEITKLSKNVCKQKKRYKVKPQAIKCIATGILAVTMSGTLFTALATARTGEQVVLHSGDTGGYSPNVPVSHWHELTKEDFMRDFLYLNPGAKDEDVIAALQNGEYEYYVQNNGSIKQHPQFTIFRFTANNDKERYENKVVPHIDHLIEEYGIEETHSRSK